MAVTTQLYEPEFLFRRNTFASFVTTWLLRYADPKKTHPKPIVESVYGFLQLFVSFFTSGHRLPLTKEVPLDFRVLPENILEDIIDYLFFAVRYTLFCWYRQQTQVFSDMGHLASSCPERKRS